MFGRSRPTLSFLDHETRRFHTKQYDTVRKAAWAARWWCDEKGRSVYFVGNSHRMEDVRKPTKDDIELCVGVWLDVDGCGWDEDVAWTLRSKLDWEPTYVAFTGGGYQAHWRFDSFTEDRYDCEAVNLWLRDQFGELPVDRNCWTCDHIWRLPGTRNRKPNRQDALCKLVHANWESRLPLAEAGRNDPPVSFAADPVSFSVDGFTLEQVKECVTPRAWQLLTHRPSKFPSRSEHEFAFIGTVLGERDPIEQTDIDLAAACLLASPANNQSVSHRAYFEPNGKPRRDPSAHVARQIRDWLSKNGRAVS
ncbi:DNA-primase RepB domain-containing protein [Algihabitans albus]|uniref:DNA-primase RepB domain-containing protein n=1 Tax=Algihabitans albus TaxID=2164067 RepID=UPI0035D0911F